MLSVNLIVLTKSHRSCTNGLLKQVQDDEQLRRCYSTVPDHVGKEFLKCQMPNQKTSSEFGFA